MGDSYRCLGCGKEYTAEQYPSKWEAMHAAVKHSRRACSADADVEFETTAS